MVRSVLQKLTLLRVAGNRMCILLWVAAVAHGPAADVFVLFFGLSIRSCTPVSVTQGVWIKEMRP